MTNDYISPFIFCMQKLFSNVAARVMQKCFQFQVQFILVLFFLGIGTVIEIILRVN